jgi:hypothetical protein
MRRFVVCRVPLHGITQSGLERCQRRRISAPPFIYAYILWNQIISGELARSFEHGLRRNASHYTWSRRTINREVFRMYGASRSQRGRLIPFAGSSALSPTHRDHRIGGGGANRLWSFGRSRRPDDYRAGIGHDLPRDRADDSRFGRRLNRIDSPT